MANKIITNSADNQQYFLHYHAFENDSGHLIQASLFNACGHLVSRNTITISQNSNTNISNLIGVLLQNNVLPPDLTNQNIAKFF